MMNFCKRTTLKEGNSLGDIPKPARIACILQLCLAFSVLLWILGAPFTEDLYHYKKISGSVQWLTTENPEFFDSLTGTQKEQLLKIGETAQNGLQETFLQKLAKGIESLFLETPISKQLWLLLALILPFMVMKQVEGAKTLFWLFPLLAALYAAQIGTPVKQEAIYPTESYLEKNYLTAPITGSIETQRDQLDSAWKSYIIAEWSRIPADRPENVRFANGLYQFIFRKTVLEANAPPLNPGLFTLACYFLWNMIAAAVVGRTRLTR